MILTLDGKRYSVIDNCLKDNTVTTLVDDIVIYKKVRNNIVLALKVPAGSYYFALDPYSDYYDRAKIRVNIAEVLMAFKIKRGKYADEYTVTVDESMVYTSQWDIHFIYTVGGIVKPWLQFDMNPIACASGIHGFLNPVHAVYWN